MVEGEGEQIQLKMAFLVLSHRGCSIVRTNRLIGTHIHAIQMQARTHTHTHTATSQTVLTAALERGSERMERRDMQRHQWRNKDVK